MRIRRWSVVPIALVTGSAAVAVVDGCSIVNGLVVAEDAGANPDTGADTGEEPDAGDGCDHARPPRAPALETEGANVAPVVVVAREIFLLPTPGEAVGFDLDDTCAETCTSPTPHPDPPRGIDNNASTLFDLIKDRTDLQTSLNTRIAQGRSTLLLRVSNYNGKLDDPSVTVSVYASPGLFEPPGSANHKAPQFVESEAWELDRSQFSPIAPLDPITTTRGHVTNGTVVASFQSATVVLSESFKVSLNAPTFTATLDLTGAKPTIKDVLIAGRWASTDILRVVARLSSADGGKFLCDEPGGYAFVKMFICQDLDIQADRTADGKGLACDALSSSLRIKAAPATLGPLRTITLDDECPGFPPDTCKGDGG